jgi:hypothetical protein
MLLSLSVGLLRNEIASELIVCDKIAISVWLGTAWPHSSSLDAGLHTPNVALRIPSYEMITTCLPLLSAPVLLGIGGLH